MSDWPDPTPEVPVYAVGDIHGCADPLQRLLVAIDADAVERGHRAEIVFVGDYIDRGEQSADVLRFLQMLTGEYEGDVTCLMGNHERMMLDFLEDPLENGPRWLRYGGAQTIASFGLKLPGAGTATDGAQLVDLAFDLRAAMGEDLVRWLTRLPEWWNSGNVWIVHAGADPDLPMEEQYGRTLLWGTDAYRARPRDDGQWVVTGHTPVPAPGAAEGRIDVDTGAVYDGGRLTAAALSPDGAVRFLQG